MLQWKSSESGNGICPPRGPEGHGCCLKLGVMSEDSCHPSLDRAGTESQGTPTANQVWIGGGGNKEGARKIEERKWEGGEEKESKSKSTPKSLSYDTLWSPGYCESVTK